jgi:hypothetical protein
MTADQRVNLKQNVQVDPLINQWYAWSYLVPPATRSMDEEHVCRKAPPQDYAIVPFRSSDARGCLEESLYAGRAIHGLRPSRVREVKTLLDRILKEQAELLALAEAIKSLDSLLEAKADGTSLEALYAEVPAPLRGHVELVYDLNNSPSFRLLEGLLYASKL